MSDPHQANSSVNCLLESLLEDDDLSRDQQYDSSRLDYFSSSLMPEKGTRWSEWDVDFIAMDATDNAGTLSDSEVDGAKVQERWIGDVEQLPMRKKRKQQILTSPAIQTRERQRGKNWEKAEEDILVDCKSKEMDWKSISECLQEHGFTRNHKHCADKWYALRKHYLEIYQWMLDNPSVEYWDRSDGERIRSVPPSFCQKWYLIFDAAEKKEGRKKVLRKPDPTAVTMDRPHPSHSLAAAFTSRSNPNSFGAQPSCSLSVPHEGLQHPGERLCNSGDATHKIECCEDGFFFSNRATGAHPIQPNFNLQVLVTEIYNLSRALTVKFAAEEEERSRNLAIKEKKLELKIQRFEYKRKRDEEKQKSVAQCLNFAVKAYD